MYGELYGKSLKESLKKFVEELFKGICEGLPIGIIGGFPEEEVLCVVVGMVGFVCKIIT